ncbi:MAG: alpha-amylase family glycosyl hydrolase [Edaphobacter sp.]|uniref:alpha-amylase family glycosyl hydrolase n=1 Tax=Edaphobacter sp. TaxID=1934404 RepID=UPI00238C67FA|nr:alpha-amylase family glycosyl hydrolase [Edaphobacter sp.]MDE1178456.1 alpha-amylase family glycosyl hydrolase [Edaphobacter sp.]
MEFHISRRIREQIDLDDLLFSFSGNVIFANVTASRKLAEQLNGIDKKSGSPGTAITGPALFAMGLIDELSHALIASYRKKTDPLALTDALQFLSKEVGSEQRDRILLAFTEQFPNVDVYRKHLTAQEWLTGQTEGAPNQEVALEELLLLWFANSNPAFAPFSVLFDDKELKDTTSYSAATTILRDYFKTRPTVEAGMGTLLEALAAPMLASPDSLTGQLDYIREHWSPVLGNDLKRVLLAIDVLREEEIAIWMRFHPPGPVWHGHKDSGGTSEGFVGNEFVGFDQQGALTQGANDSPRRYARDYQAPLHEYEAFSADQAWMPTVVLIAKNTYVWLEQLSKKYGRHIHRLDQIPDSELQLLADRGITGLWLIGLWERSHASMTIKRLRGNSDAVASAYSLKNYTIAQDLGGENAYQHLKHHAAAVGLRLASDMVPNHMGIDSDWVIEHPDWFLSRWESPFPAYRFDGPDISTDPRVEIKIEDHYYDHSDAAVVFRLRHYANGTTRYVYHGNDGTAFAWNDTAQLDYLKSEVREHVIQVILDVAKRFPIIRFDAAMVLAKRHVQRLWFPLPGTGGSIPSRAENAMSDEAFNALMPHEFWREVVDRVATEVPGTLLLAEAFWLLEGYFVRTLGMHRVYNSAFMNMLRDEENAKYRSYLKKTVEFDPDILKRYVNFMSNPDERTAIDQFGTGDKYFGVSMLLATLPGLPMFGHGQIEGLTERYGMDFKQARLDEFPNDDLIARHQHLIAPLLKSRYLFAESEHFLLYDFWNDHGIVDENVFAYSNRHGNERAVILYNNSYQSTHGTIHLSVGFLDKASGAIQQKSLSHGLNLPNDDSMLIAYRDNVAGLEFLRYAGDLRDNGLPLALRGYQHVALLNWRELRPTAAQPWDRLCNALHGSGVYSLEEALSKLQIRPLLETLRKAVSTESIETFAALSSQPGTDKGSPLQIAPDSSPIAATAKLETQDINLPSTAEFVKYAHHFKDQVHELLVIDSGTAVTGSLSDTDSDASRRKEFEDWIKASLKLPTTISALPAELRPVAIAVFPSLDATSSSMKTWGPVLTWLVFQTLSPEVTPFEVFDKFNLRWALAETFSSIGLEGEAAWKAAAQIRVLLKFSTNAEKAFRTEEFWTEPDVRWLIGVNNAGGTEFINQERLEELLFWIQLPQLLQLASSPKSLASPATVAKQVTDYVGLLQRAGFKYAEFISSVGDEAPLPDRL